MCPACLASAALLVGGVISTGGVSALVAKIATARRRGKSAVASPADAPQEFQFPQINKNESKGE
jgi:hypothetical protein